MLNKTPKKFWLKFGLKLGAAGIALELLALGGSYVFWRKLNTSGEFRQYCSEKYPAILEGYYKVGEIFDSDNIQALRKLDQENFNKTKPIE